MLNASSKAPILRVAAERPAGLNGARIAVMTLASTVLIFLSSEILGSLIISAVPVLLRWPAGQGNSWLKGSSVSLQFTYGLLADGLMLAGIVGMLKVFGWKLSDIGLKAPKFWHILVGAATAGPYYVFLLLLVVVLSAFVPSFNVLQKQELGFDSITNGFSLSLTFVSLVVLPPIVEEIAMRGFLYTGLRKWLPKVVAALIVSGLFGAAHLAEGGSAGPLWIGAIDTFTLSLFLVSLREITGNLWAGITLHAVKNLIAFVPFLMQRLH